MRKEFFIILAIQIIFAGKVVCAPNGGVVTSGDALIVKSENETQIIQVTDNVDILWSEFNVGVDEKVVFDQPSKSSIALNHILGRDPSSIEGQLISNGKIWIVNPNGVVFGKGAKVDVGSILVSTMLPEENSDAKEFVFEGGDNSFIENSGDIKSDQGYIVFLSNSVVNNGRLISKNGSIYLASGSKISLKVDGNDLHDIIIDENKIKSLIDNKGVIVSDGGHIVLSAGARDSLVSSQINHSGVLQAKTIERKNGRIILKAGLESGTADISGTIDASALKGVGGFIETSAANVQVSDSAVITTFSGSGDSGTWLIDPKDYYISSDGGDITGAQLSSSLELSNVVIESVNGSGGVNGDLFVNDSVQWNSNNKLTLKADRDVIVNKSIVATNGKLSLEFAQNDSSGKYIIKAPIKLPEGNNFSTKNSTQPLIDYYVVTDLGGSTSTTGQDLQGINGNLSGNYALGNTVDATETANWGGGFTPLGGARQGSGAAFTGRFEGLGNSIKYLSLRSDSSYFGLFGVTGQGSVISNLVLENLAFEANHVVSGSVVGSNSGKLFNVVSKDSSLTTSSVTRFVGGLVGQNTNTGSLFLTGYEGLVEGGALSGGLVGINNGSITQSFMTGKVTGLDRLGGLVGDNRAQIDQSYSKATVEVASGHTGGLVGYNAGQINQAFFFWNH